MRWSGFGESALGRLRGELGACRDAELGEDVAQVHLDGSAGDEHAFRDLRVGEPGRGQADDRVARWASGCPIPPTGACVRRVPARRTRSSRRAAGSRLRSSAVRTISSPRRSRAASRRGARAASSKGRGRESDRGSQRVGGGEAAHRLARALGIERERAERVERGRDARLQVVPRLTVQRRVQQVFGSSRLAARLGDERALVLDQARRSQSLLYGADERGGLVERGLRGVEVAGHPLRRAEHPEELRRPQRARRRSRVISISGSTNSRAVAASPVASAMSARSATASPSANPPPSALARAINASRPAAAPARSPVSARAPRSNASVKPPVDGSPTRRQLSSRPGELRPGDGVVAAMHREVADHEAIPGEEELALELLADRPELRRARRRRPLRRARRSTRPSSSSNRRRRPSRRRSLVRARCCAPSWARPASGSKSTLAKPSVFKARAGGPVVADGLGHRQRLRRPDLHGLEVVAVERDVRRAPERTRPLDASAARRRRAGPGRTTVRPCRDGRGAPRTASAPSRIAASPRSRRRRRPTPARCRGCRARPRGARGTPGRRRARGAAPAARPGRGSTRSAERERRRHRPTPRAGPGGTDGPIRASGSGTRRRRDRPGPTTCRRAGSR